MKDLTPGRPRASSDAPLIENRDISASPPSASDADAASRQSQTAGSQSPRASNEEPTSPEIEHPSRLHVPDARFASVQPPSERRLSV
jgi:hypothetical protein